MESVIQQSIIADMLFGKSMELENPTAEANNFGYSIYIYIKSEFCTCVTNDKFIIIYARLNVSEVLPLLNIVPY